MIKTKSDLYYYLRKDKEMLKVPKQTFYRKVVNILFPLEIWEFEKTLRYAEYYNNRDYSFLMSKIIGRMLTVIYKYKLRKKSIRLGFDIPINVFGPGLSIAHYGTIIVNGSARIGANCRLHSSVNIGASAGNRDAPHIGDNCYIGPGAILFGGINIGDNVTIAANATVNRSCLQNNVILAGTPAKVVKEGVGNWLDFNNLNL